MDRSNATGATCLYRATRPCSDTDTDTDTTVVQPIFNMPNTRRPTIMDMVSEDLRVNGRWAVPAAELRRLEERVRDLERLLGRKTMENEILKEALDLARAKKAILLSSSVPPDGSR